ncbi:hypothetical protein E2C01_091867 [Portunus trituberculatus]|uniref:Uncharacterized protein n=1 Tax=Portunus trituberculatus TaxID=210409 RepID=A0A5B7JIP7_PORTR|nr:hypothetical protein [Portunus trituberculatus]
MRSICWHEARRVRLAEGCSLLSPCQPCRCMWAGRARLFRGLHMFSRPFAPPRVFSHLNCM